MGEAATSGAAWGGVDGAARTTYDQVESGEGLDGGTIAMSAVEGTIGGAVAGVGFGGAMKGIGKLWGKVFGRGKANAKVETKVETETKPEHLPTETPKPKEGKLEGGKVETPQPKQEVKSEVVEGAKPEHPQGHNTEVKSEVISDKAVGKTKQEVKAKVESKPNSTKGFEHTSDSKVLTYEEYKQQYAIFGDGVSEAQFKEMYNDYLISLSKKVSQRELLSLKTEDLSKMDFFSTFSDAERTALLHSETVTPQLISVITGDKPAVFIDCATLKIDYSKIKLNSKLADKFDIVDLGKGGCVILNKLKTLENIERNRDLFTSLQALKLDSDIEVIYESLINKTLKEKDSHGLVGLALGFPKFSTIIFELNNVLIKNGKKNLYETNLPLFKEEILKILHSENSPYKNLPKETLSALEKHIKEMTKSETFNGNAYRFRIFGNEEAELKRILAAEDNFANNFKLEDYISKEHTVAKTQVATETPNQIQQRLIKELETAKTREDFARITQEIKNLPKTAEYNEARQSLGVAHMKKYNEWKASQPEATRSIVNMYEEKPQNISSFEMPTKSNLTDVEINILKDNLHDFKNGKGLVEIFEQTLVEKGEREDFVSKELCELINKINFEETPELTPQNLIKLMEQWDKEPKEIMTFLFESFATGREEVSDVISRIKVVDKFKLIEEKLGGKHYIDYYYTDDIKTILNASDVALDNATRYAKLLNKKYVNSVDIKDLAKYTNLKESDWSKITKLRSRLLEHSVNSNQSIENMCGSLDNIFIQEKRAIVNSFIDTLEKNNITKLSENSFSYLRRSPNNLELYSTFLNARKINNSASAQETIKNLIRFVEQFPQYKDDYIKICDCDSSIQFFVAVTKLWNEHLPLKSEINEMLLAGRNVNQVKEIIPLLNGQNETEILNILKSPFKFNNISEIEQLIKLKTENKNFTDVITNYIQTNKRKLDINEVNNFLELIKTNPKEKDLITSLSKNSNFTSETIIKFIELKKEYSTNQKMTQLLDFLAVEDKSSFARILHVLEECKSNPEFADIYLNNITPINFLDSANVSSNVRKKANELVEKLGDKNRVETLKELLSSSYDNITWENFVKEGMTDREINIILDDLIEKSTSFTRISFVEKNYGKNPAWASSVQKSMDKTVARIEKGADFDELLNKLAIDYHHESVSHGMKLDTETGIRRGFSERELGWSYTNFDNVNYSEYKNRFREVWSKYKGKKESPYSDVVLTQVTDTQMEHPFDKGGTNGNNAIAHCKELYNKLMPLFEKVEQGQKLSENEFKFAEDNIAEIHFLLANSMPYVRGSAGISDCLTRSFYKALGKDAPIIKKGVGLDLEAFARNLDDYKANWRTFFAKGVDKKPVSMPSKTLSYEDAMSILLKNKDKIPSFSALNREVEMQIDGVTYKGSWLGGGGSKCAYKTNINGEDVCILLPHKEWNNALREVNNMKQLKELGLLTNDYSEIITVKVNDVEIPAIKTKPYDKHSFKIFDRKNPNDNLEKYIDISKFDEATLKEMCSELIKDVEILANNRIELGSDSINMALVNGKFRIFLNDLPYQELIDNELTAKELHKYYMETSLEALGASFGWNTRSPLIDKLQDYMGIEEIIAKYFS